MLFVKFVNTLSAYFCFRCKKKLNENGQKTGRARKICFIRVTGASKRSG